MKKTICLYDTHPYDTEFEALVERWRPAADGKGYEVILDQTLFFPEQGGQTPDRGVLFVNDARIPVLDVQIEDGVIWHLVEEKIPEGEKIRGEIDWDYRFSNMQQHTGEHIFSGLVHSRFGYENVGFHLSDSIVTMDFDGVLTKEQVAEIEWEANRVIASDLEVEASYPTADVLAAMTYRSKKELEGDVRIVTIPGVDVCACCAPHVRHTGEVGQLKIMHVQNYKGGVRLSVLCGYRSLLAFRKRSEQTERLMNLLNSSEEELAVHIQRLQRENQNLAYELVQMQEKYLMQQVRNLEKGTEHVVLFIEDCNARAIRSAVNTMTAEHEGYCGVFAGNDEKGYCFIIGSRNGDCSKKAVELREMFGARGGGGKEMIQGSVMAKREQLESWILQQKEEG